MVEREQRAALLAAWINGVLVALIPVWLALASRWNADLPVRPPGGTGLESVLQVLPLLYFFSGLGTFAGWRTHAHARAYVTGQSAGWLAILEPAGLGFAVAIFLLSSAIRFDPGGALPYIVTYGGGAAVAGLAIGIVLRLIAVLVIRVTTRTGFHMAEGTRATG